ncbi:DNA helicase [Planctomycetales bacterium]|nr:DNA helicase [Planctomycetales bacterium]
MKNTVPAYLLEGLNASQREAVLVKDGPLLVLAGPGSGKTRVVTHRIAALLHQNVYPSQIAALTFTNKAAGEMKKRLERLAPEKYVWIGTFHKFCAYLLRRYISHIGLQDNFTIYDTDESLALIKSIAARNPLPASITPQRVQNTISSAKNQLVLPDDYTAASGSQIGQCVAEIYPLYQDELRRANAVDFDDLLLHTAVLLKENPEIRRTLDNRFRYVLVDEYQDTNSVQYVIAKALSLDHRNLAVTGDPDQSIYGWRGANINNILDFEKDFPDAKTIRLEENYRSTPQILAVADALIANNIYRKEKKLFTQNPAGLPVRLVRCIDQREEADTIAAEIAREIQSGKRQPKDYAIFYRMNALSRNLEHALRSQKIPFQLIRGLEFFNRKEVKDVLAYLRVIFNPADTVSLTRIINEPARGIGKTTLQKLANRANELGVATLNIARDIDTFAGVAVKTKKAVQQFVALMDRLSDLSAQEYPVASLIEAVLNESGYRKQYAESESEEDQERLENIEELITVAKEFDERETNVAADSAALLPAELRSSLEEFLEQAALVSDVDALEDDTNRVSLMTLHAAKGLEYPVVYIIALEDGILPHERSTHDPAQLEEERRLFFVGITRAEEELRISRAERRDFRGSFGVSAIFSRFLLELPNDKDMVRLDSADDISLSEDYGDGVRLVNDKTFADEFADENAEEGVDVEEVEVEIEYVEYDAEYSETGEPIKPQKKTKKPKRNFSMMTAADLLEKNR